MSATAVDVTNAAKADPGEDNPWPQRLGAWKTFSEDFHTRGRKIEKRYEDVRDTTLDIQTSLKKVNIFYSNTTVIKESLYNSLPKPDVSRMHKGEWDNEAARVAATIMERALSYEVKCAQWFDQAVKSAILDRLVPGMGVAWVNFVNAKGSVPEHMTVDIVYWKDFIYEPQRAWEQVTWAGRKIHMAPSEAKKRWGDKATGLESSNDPRTVEEAIEAGKVCIIQMWDKNTKKVHFLTVGGVVLETADDPYRLRDFFPCPKPLIASPATRQFLPLPEYYMAQDQYLELDILYSRINLIIEAIKVAGVYDAAFPTIPRMLNGNENQLVPVDNWAMFAEKGGVSGHIDWFPVETIAQVLTHLVSTFAFIKDQLFEVTGMADIIRGSSNQYETLGAQQIKAQFASVRMNGFQRDTATFVTGILRIMADLMCQLYSDDKISKCCGILPMPDQQFVQGPAGALALLRNDYQSMYSIDIESDSLTQADWGLEQSQRLAYIQSLSTFLTSAVPAAEANPELAPLLVQMIKFASVGFKGSNELEGTIDAILDQLLQQQAAGGGGKEEKPDPAVLKAQAEITALQQKAELDKQERMAKMQYNHEEHQQELQFKRESHMMDLQFEEERNRQKLMLAEAAAAREAQQDDARAAAGILNDAAKAEAKAGLK